MIKGVLAWGASPLMPALFLVVALVYSQIGWRSDRAAYSGLQRQLQLMREQQGYPEDGEELTASGLRVVRGDSAIALADLLRGRGGIVYFERRDCTICQWFSASMDTLMPAWRDSFVVIHPYMRPDTGLPFSTVMLDSASSRILVGVPALLVIDSTGLVRNSVSAGLPQVIRVLESVGVIAPSLGEASRRP